MSQLRVIVLGETSAAGKQWLGLMQERSIFEVHAATDQESIFEDFEQVGDVPVVIVENLPGSQADILALRRNGYPHYILWFGAEFSKEDCAFAIEQRVYAVFEKPDAEDKKTLHLIQKLQFNVSRSTHFNSLVHGLKSLLIQLTAAEQKHPLFAELKAATTKLEELEGQNEFSFSGLGKANAIENPVLSKEQEELGAAIEAMEDLERTGALWVRSQEGEGRIEFLQGKIVFAEAAGATGLKAVFRMFLWNEPNFLFARELANEVPFDGESAKYPIDLVAQGRRYKLMYEKIREELPPSGIRLEINANEVTNKTALNPKNFDVLSTVVEFGRVAEIVDYNPLPDSEIYHSLIDLRKHNLIRVSEA